MRKRSFWYFFFLFRVSLFKWHWWMILLLFAILTFEQTTYWIYTISASVKHIRLYLIYVVYLLFFLTGIQQYFFSCEAKFSSVIRIYKSSVIFQKYLTIDQYNHIFTIFKLFAHLVLNSIQPFMNRALIEEKLVFDLAASL